MSSYLGTQLSTVVLEVIDHVQYLGVDISKNVGWHTYINRIAANANETAGFWKKNTYTKHKIICNVAGKAIGQSQVEYAFPRGSLLTNIYR